MPAAKYVISFDEQTTLFKQISDWIACTPPLLKPNNTLAKMPFYPNTDVSPLAYTGNSRLGFWYQHLCLQHFHSHPDYQLIADEIQLNNNGRTIGAIDFIVKHRPTDTVEHWEVAIKFYILFDGLWFGPNSKDRLDLKLSHMLEHQLNMSNHECFKQQYPQLEHIHPQLLLQGRLYTNPFRRQEVPTSCLGYDINRSQVNGYWCFWSEFENVEEPLYALKKGQWLTGRNDQNALLTSETDEFVHCQSRSGDFWFVLPNDWPYNHSSHRKNIDSQKVMSIKKREAKF